MQYGNLAEIYDSLIYDMPYDKWEKFISENVSGKTALELGCGTGNMTKRLVMKYDVTAIDISEEMLEKADENLRKCGRRPRLAVGDMTVFTLNKPVDLVLCACDGLNYLTTLEKVKKAFQTTRKNLKKDGIFVFDISTRKKLKNMDNQLYSEDTDDITYIWRNSYDEKTNIITMDISFFLHQNDDEYIRFDEIHTQRAHEVDEIADLLKECSFEILSVTDDYSDKTDIADSDRITFCARAI